LILSNPRSFNFWPFSILIFLSLERIDVVRSVAANNLWRLGVRRGGDGPEEEEENDIEQGVGKEVEDEEAAAFGRSHQPSGSSEEREQPDLDADQCVDPAVSPSRQRQHGAEDAGDGADRAAAVADLGAPDRRGIQRDGDGHTGDTRSTAEALAVPVPGAAHHGVRKHVPVLSR